MELWFRRETARGLASPVSNIPFMPSAE